MPRELNIENVQRIVKATKQDYVDAGYSEAQQNNLEDTLFAAIAAVLWLQGVSVIEASTLLVPHATELLRSEEGARRAAALEATIAEEFGETPMNNRALTPPMFVENLMEFQDVLKINNDEKRGGGQPDFTEQQLAWLNGYMIHMTDTFGISVLHCMGVDVPEAATMVQALVSRMPPEARNLTQATMQHELDEAYNEYIEFTAREEATQH